MSYEYIAPNTTWCEPNPSNQRDFERSLASLLSGTSLVKRSASETLNQALQRQIARENKMLRSLRSYLPGLEPDHF